MAREASLARQFAEFQFLIPYKSATGATLRTRDCFELVSSARPLVLTFVWDTQCLRKLSITYIIEIRINIQVVLRACRVHGLHF